MVAINLLHLTDLHQGAPEGWQWPRYREAFFEDLKRLHAVAGPWDLILFSGDLTHGGTKEEFDDLEITLGEILGQLEQLGSQPKILAVPGNHDLLRKKVEAPPVANALSNLAEQESKQSQVWEQVIRDYGKDIRAAFANFIDWRDNSAHVLREKDIHYGNSIPGDFSATYEKDGVRLGIVGLNSAFTQVNNGDFKGKLSIHGSQLLDACGKDPGKWLADHDAAMLMTHHPPDWFYPNARNCHFDGHIYAKDTFFLHLFGHVHESRMQTISEQDFQNRRSWSGVSLFGSFEYIQHTEKKVRAHGYAAMRLEIGAGKQAMLRVWPRQAKSHKSHVWLTRDDAFDLQQFTKDATESSFAKSFELKRPVKANDHDAAAVIDRPTEWRQQLTELAEKSPPHIAVLAESLLYKEEGADLSRDYRYLATIIRTHVGALIAAASLVVQQGKAYPKPEKIDWVNDPASLVEDPNSLRGCHIVFQNQGSPAKIASAMREATNVVGEKLPGALSELIHSVHAALLWPVYEVGTINELDDDEREVEYCQWQRARQVPHKRVLSKSDEGLSSGHCFVLIPERHSQGWLVDLYPFVTRVRVNNDAHNADPLGLIASPSLEAGLPTKYHVDGKEENASPTQKHPKARKSKGAFHATSGWLNDDIDQHLIDAMKSSFVIKRRLGWGGFGTVYLVSHAALAEQEFAAKVFHSYALFRDRDDKRMVRDIDKVRKLQRSGQLPHIVKYPEMADAVRLNRPGYRWIVMEYVKGDTLSEWCRQSKRQFASAHCEQRKRKLIRDLVRGVASLHQHGIIHRDLHPDNVIVRRKEEGEFEPVIIDLGLAWFAPQAGSSMSSMSMTALGGFGREPYAPAEQRLGKSDVRHDPWVDVHALGWMIAMILKDGEVPADLDAFDELGNDGAIAKRCTSRDGRICDAHDLLHQLQRAAHQEESFGVGCSLADGCYAIAETPIPGDGNILQVVLPARHADVRAWAIRILLGGERAGHFAAFERKWRQLQAAGLPICPWMSSGREGKQGIVGIAVPERYMFSDGEWVTFERWDARVKGVRQLGACLASVLRLIASISSCKVAVRIGPKDVLISPSGELCVFRIGLPGARSASEHDWLSAIDRARMAIPDVATESFAPLEEFHATSGDDVASKGGWLEKRDLTALLQNAMRLLHARIGTFDGVLSAWTDKDGAILDALTMGLPDVLNGWSDRTDVFTPGEAEQKAAFEREKETARQKYEAQRERERIDHEAREDARRVEHNEEQERKRIEHDDEQERKRIEHNEEQERRRIEHEPREDARLAEHDDEQERKRIEYDAEDARKRAEHKSNPNGKMFEYEPFVPDPFVPDPFVPEPFNPEPFVPEPFLRNVFDPEPFVFDGWTEHDRRQHPSTIELAYARPALAREDPRPQDDPPLLDARQFVEAHTRINAPDVVVRREALDVTLSGAWLIAMLVLHENVKDIASKLKDIAENYPHWRPLTQLSQLLGLEASCTRLEACITASERNQLANVVVRLVENIDRARIPLPEKAGEATRAIDDLSALVATIMQDVEITAEENDCVVVRQNQACAVLRPPLVHRVERGKLQWIHGVRQTETKLEVHVGAPPDQPTTWREFDKFLAPSKPASMAWQMLLLQMLAIFDAPDSVVDVEQVDDMLLLTCRMAENRASVMAIDWQDERSHVTLDDLLNREAMRKMFETWRARTTNESIAHNEVSVVCHGLPLGIVNNCLDRTTGMLSDAFFDNEMLIDAWAKLCGAERSTVTDFGRALRIHVLSKTAWRDRLDELLLQRGLRFRHDPRQEAAQALVKWVQDAKPGPSMGRLDFDNMVKQHGLLAICNDSRIADVPPVQLYIHGNAQIGWNVKPTCELDWTDHFKLTNRHTRNPNKWQETLWPELEEAKAQLAATRDADGKHIDLRAKLPPGATLALGVAFPIGEGFRLRILQQTAQETVVWHSDAAPADTHFNVEHERLTMDGPDVLFVVSISSDVMEAVEEWRAARMPDAFRAMVHLTPQGGPSQTALTSDHEAVALADEIVVLIRDARERYRGERTHIILRAPEGFCLFVGQRLAHVGNVVIYEHESEKNRYSTTIEMTT